MELKYLLSRLSTGAKMDHVELIPLFTLSCPNLQPWVLKDHLNTGIWYLSKVNNHLL